MIIVCVRYYSIALPVIFNLPSPPIIVGMKYCYTHFIDEGTKTDRN